MRHEPATAYRLSRHAIVRADGSALVAYSPLSTVTLAFVEASCACVLAALATGGRCAADLATVSGLDAAFAERLLDELVTASLAVTCSDHEAQEENPPHVLWSPEELAVHERSRVGHHVLPVGGTYRFRGRFAPDAIRRDTPGAPSVPLSTPDLDAVARAEPSFTAVAAARRSIREHDDDNPITVDQLAEFLYRVGRTDDLREAGGQEVGRRPYPTGGQICELELYPLVSRCAGIAPGLYHYESVGHRLELVAEPDHLSDRALRYARAAAAMTREPQVLIICTARMTRLMWKYEGLAYPMALKDAGVLTGLMYLVGTAMRLAPCGVGSGDSAAFAALSGLDPLVEPSIADFLLGSRKPREER
jgi:SagB-type dehydrogenase family enzyme